MRHSMGCAVELFCVVLVLSGCPGDDADTDGDAGTGGASSGSGGNAGDAGSSAGVGGVAGSSGSGAGGSGAGGSGAGGSGGTAGATDGCDCGRESYLPVCGTDGQNYDATCGRECVPVAIACDGECPCSGGGDLRWFETCGDPVCGVSPDPSDDPGIPNCTTQQLGDACADEGERCDGVLSCGASLICAASDPTAGPGGCPRSRARFKDEIEYLNERQLREYHAQVTSLPLASYRYRYADGAGPQLGFIIEDIEPSVAVSGNHVNMYGYLSMAVAAIQVQQEQIVSLQREIEQLRAHLPAESSASCGP